MNQAFELLLVILTCVGIVFANKQLNSSYASVRKKQTLVVAFGFCLVYLVLVRVNFPHMLQPTDPKIIEHKKANRQRCLEATQRGDLLSAEKSVYNSSLCKQMAKEKEDGRVTFSKLVTKYSNPIVFTMGSMFAVAPFIALMILSHLRLFKGSERFWHVTLPAVNVTCVCSVLVFMFFHLWVEGNRVDKCSLTSGHWYTYVMATWSCLWVLAHLISHDLWPNDALQPVASDATPGIPAFSAVTAWYVAWAALYQTLALRVLVNTQRFHHDHEEAADGIMAALYCIPLLLVGGYVVDMSLKGNNTKGSVTSISASSATSSTAAPSSTAPSIARTPSLSRTPSSAARNSSSSTNATPVLNREMSRKFVLQGVPSAPPIDAAPPSVPAAPELSEGSSSSQQSDDSSSGGLLAEIRKKKLNKVPAKKDEDDVKPSEETSKPKPAPGPKRVPPRKTEQPRDLMSEMRAKMKQRRAATEEDKGKDEDSGGF